MSATDTQQPHRAHHAFVLCSVAIAVLLVVLLTSRVMQERASSELPYLVSPAPSGLTPEPDWFALQLWIELRGGPPAQRTPLPAPREPVPVQDLLLEQHRPAGHRVYRERPDGWRPKAIVLHATGSGAPGSSFASVAALGRFFARDAARASAHYGIGRDGTVARYVHDQHAAFHVATPGWNDISIGIELLNDNSGQDPYPSAQLEAARRLVRQLAAQWQIPLEGIVTHASVQPVDRRDPVGFPWRDWRARLPG